MKYAGSGGVDSRIGWQRILILEPGSTLSLWFSGAWKVNDNWGVVGYQGNGTYLGGPRYPGPGLPEGCMLARRDEATKAFYQPSLPWIFSGDDVTTVYLRVNDEDAGLGDNGGTIDFSFEYLITR